jgi:integrase
MLMISRWSDGKIDPLLPMKGWRTAWRSLTKAAGLEGLRFHDLRHQAITELAERSQGDQTIMSIAGHVSREMLEYWSITVTSDWNRSGVL